MQAGTSWEGVGLRVGRDVAPTGRRNRLRVGIAVSLVALFVSTFAALAFAASAEAVSCGSVAFTPYKSSAYGLTGSARVRCTSGGTSKTLYMGVYRSINNFPDRVVCEDTRTSRYAVFTESCSGSFSNAGNFYTHATGAGGRDYSATIYARPG